VAKLDTSPRSAVLEEPTRRKEASQEEQEPSQEEQEPNLEELSLEEPSLEETSQQDRSQQEQERSLEETSLEETSPRRSRAIAVASSVTQSQNASSRTRIAANAARLATLLRRAVLKEQTRRMTRQADRSQPTGARTKARIRRSKLVEEVHLSQQSRPSRRCLLQRPWHLVRAVHLASCI
jgi:hypothetical protein